MSAPKIGFIGFGEAATNICAGLTAEGVSGLSAFDVVARPQQDGVTLTATVEDLLAASDVVFAAVTCTVALDVAKQAAPFLTERHLYVDINSVAPDTKIAVGKLVMDNGARYVEAAVMAGVPGYRHKVPMLLSGEAAPELIAAMAPLGMELEDFGPELGRASALKMFRSIMIKGMEALFQECVLGAEHYGVAKKVLDSIADGYPGIDWDHMAHHLIGRTAIHGERRAHEMDEVAETLKAIGIEPIMSEAASKRIMWAANKGLKEAFPGDAPSDYRDVIKAIKAYDD
ncbi:MAG: NAD(P)-dependent oxidoreductase [Alphaproteobacteria bacterium]|jgi:3-hydroxyisobutyrate dehydrogenase-like beta-hydroxyacid dehydrogenase|nr:NAD(P)-dependent oxidoreductase [Alphaproteobacteria bacterium]